MQNKIIIFLKFFLIDLLKKKCRKITVHTKIFKKSCSVKLFILIKYELSNFSKIRIIIKDTRFIPYFKFVFLKKPIKMNTNLLK